MKTTKNLEPRASALVESMRDVGYSLATAIADIIDNAIAAKANQIEILADTTSAHPMIGIIDNGIGMPADDLYEAMRLGTKSPLEERAETDLGRFGLGLKTASFSQCRCLTVVSRHNNKTACAVWDLDYVAVTNQWLIKIPTSSKSIHWADRLGDTGTLVLWENLDRFLEGNSDQYHNHLKHQINATASHIELVFHRFMSTNKSSSQGIRILLNGRLLQAYDPFHSNHPATQFHPEDVVMFEKSKIRIQPVTLPHHHKASAADWEKYGGNQGYLKNQGFYVYRNNRLIVHGTWFGLARQSELTKLSRVQIDIPNSMDADWKIDIRKASAQPPPAIRERLKKLMERIAVPSKRTFKKRAVRLTSTNPLPVWIRMQNGHQISYEINPKHPIIAQFLEDLDAAFATRFSILIDMLNKSLPLDALFIDAAENPKSLQIAADLPDRDLIELARSTIAELYNSGISNKHAMLIIQSTEPFRSNWSLIENNLLSSTSKEDKSHAR